MEEFQFPRIPRILVIFSGISLHFSDFHGFQEADARIGLELLAASCVLSPDPTIIDLQTSSSQDSRISWISGIGRIGRVPVLKDSEDVIDFHRIFFDSIVFFRFSWISGGGCPGRIGTSGNGMRAPPRPHNH